MDLNFFGPGSDPIPPETHPRSMQNIGFGGSQRQREAQALCDSLLGKKSPKIYMMGDSFYHRSIWTDRIMIEVVCAWASAHPQTRPDRSTIDEWIAESAKIVSNFYGGKGKESEDYIVIAALPPGPSYGTVSNGGAIHEIAHGLYSRRKPYTPDEVQRLIVDVWDLIPDWSAVGRALLDAGNSIDDPRIERAMMEDYPGSSAYIAELRRWGWDRDRLHLEEEHAKLLLEKEEFEKAQKENPDTTTRSPQPKNRFNKVCVLLIALAHTVECEERDKFFEFYKENLPDIWEMCNGGVLSPIVEQMKQINLKDYDAVLQIAIQFVSLLAHAIGNSEAFPAEQSGDQDCRIACPQCGGKNTKTVLHRSNEQDKQTGTRRGTTVCGDCGAQWSSRFNPPQENEEGDGEGKGQPVIDLDKVDRNTEKLKKKAEKDRGDDSEDSEGEGDGSEAEGGDKPVDPSAGEDAPYCGHKGDLIESLAEEAIGKTLKDDPLVELIQDSLEAFVKGEWANEARKSSVGAPYRPYSPGIDKVVIPEVTDEVTALRGVNQALEEAAETTAEIRERLRRLVVSLRATRIVHGLRRGTHLSERVLADTGAELMLGRYPKTPFKQKLHQPDARFSAIVVLDQSGSMYGMIQKAMQVMLAIVDPIDDLGFPVAAVGFQDSYDSSLPRPKERLSEEYHRSAGEGVQIILYKNFDTPFVQTKARFATCAAGGGTPMAEGVQAALEWIEIRKEPLKFVFVVTDGCPNGSTEEVIARQVHMAREKNILIVGVGVGAGTEATVRLFSPHGISVPTLKEVPEPLLNLIVDRIMSL